VDGGPLQSIEGYSSYDTALPGVVGHDDTMKDPTMKTLLTGPGVKEYGVHVLRLKGTVNDVSVVLQLTCSYHVLR